jgi:hypothetical protein
MVMTLNDDALIFEMQMEGGAGNSQIKVSITSYPLLDLPFRNKAGAGSENATLSHPFSRLIYIHNQFQIPLEPFVMSLYVFTYTSPLPSLDAIPLLP